MSPIFVTLITNEAGVIVPRSGSPRIDEPSSFQKNLEVIEITNKGLLLENPCLYIPDRVVATWQHSVQRQTEAVDEESNAVLADLLVFHIMLALVNMELLRAGRSVVE